MSIKHKLGEILNEAAGNRPADQAGGETASEKIESDITKSGGFGGKTKRGADKGGELEAHEGTKVNDPLGKVTKGKGTEVQGNSNADDGLDEGESVSDRIMSRLAESIDFKADMTALKGLCESQELGEEFANSAVEIFEAAVNDVIQSKMHEICESATNIVVESIEAYASKLEEDVDAYLDYVVTEWAEENRIAIVQSARVGITESFMDQMKSLLESHYVEVPESKLDLYESAVQVGEELVQQLQESADRIAMLESALVETQKDAVVESVVSGMSNVRADKIRQLSESIAFDGDVEAFASKLQILSEGYVGQTQKSSSSLTEDVGDFINKQESITEAAAPSVAPEVDAAVKALGKFVRR